MCCSSETNVSQDPNVGQAALKQARVAEDALAFAKDYYTDTIAPLVSSMTDASRLGQEQQKALFDLQYPQAQAQAEQYTKYGLPAQEEYYKMVQQYSEPEEYERQAQMAMGDTINAQQAQQATMERQLAARGINPTSGMSIGMRNASSVLNAATSAAAANRARNAARQMGMQLKSGAADFSSGRPASNITMFAGGAGNASQAGYGMAGSAIGYANEGGALPMQSYNMAGNIYGQQMSTYADLAKMQAQLNQQSASGLGQFAGSIFGAAGAAGGFGALFSSDRRLKKGITRIGTLANGLPVYTFEYIWGGGQQVGVMADEVEKVLPDAVVTGPDGYKLVNYSMLG